MLIEKRKWERLKYLIQDYSPEVKKILQDIENKDTERQLLKKYKEKVMIPVLNIHTRETREILCFKISEHLCVGKDLTGTKFAIYHLPTKLAFGVYGKKKDIIKLAEQINDLGLDISTKDKAKHTLANDERFIDLLSEFRRKA